jgi:hypothetical protein
MLNLLNYLSVDIATMSVAAFKLQQRRRDQERLLHEKESFLRQHYNTERMLDWENRTNAKIHQREVVEYTNRLLREDEEELRERQADLASLYNGEMNEWKKDLRQKLEVTPQQRMEQIRSRAYALKAQREAERQEFVKECYQRQWREACDDLRAIDSKATLDRLAEDRKLMMLTKEAMEKNKVEDEGSGNMSFLDKDENDENNQRRQINMQTKQALDVQLQWKREQQAAISAERQREEEDQLRHLAHLEQQSKDAHNALLQKAKKEGDEMYQETLARAKLREEQRQLERDHDWILLQHALDIERNQIAAENAKKEEGKEAGARYVQCLRAQADQDVKDRQKVNAIRDEASEKIFKKNDEKLAAEANRRRQWMDEVKISRQEQIRMKEEEAERRRLDEDAELREGRAAFLRQEEIERQREEQAKADRIQNMLANKAIMEKRAKDREMEQQEKFLLNKQIQYAERVHRQKLEGYRV